MLELLHTHRQPMKQDEAMDFSWYAALPGHKEDSLGTNAGCHRTSDDMAIKHDHGMLHKMATGNEM
jgi:hypothetical protein